MDFNWEFDDKVNILAGINGSYKTKLLNIIKRVTNHEDIGYSVSVLEANYTDDIKLTYIRSEKDIKSILDDSNANRVVIEMLQKEHLDWFAGNDVQNEAILNNKTVDFTSLFLHLSPDFMDTLEITLSPSATESHRVMVDALCEKYAPKAKVRESGIKNLANLK